MTDASWLDSFMASLWFPFVAGLLIQVAATQWLKLYLPHGWDDRRRRRATNLIALVAGVVPTLSILVGMGCPDHQLWLAGVVGFAGPMLYKALTAVAYSRWPALEGTLSAHGRARRKRNGLQ